MKINLGREEVDWEAYHKDNPSPMVASSPSEPDSDDDKPKRMVYPSIYISDAPPDIGEMPDEGTATIKYKVTEKSVTDRNGKRTGRCEIEVRSITPNKSGVKATDGDGETDSDAAIDDYFSGDGEKE